MWTATILSTSLVGAVVAVVQFDDSNGNIMNNAFGLDLTLDDGGLANQVSAYVDRLIRAEAVFANLAQVASYTIDPNTDAITTNPVTTPLPPITSPVS